MPAPRSAIVSLCTENLPETNKPDTYLHWNQIGFDHIAKDYGQGSGTTCGFLPHWLLWRFGCRDNTLVNRSSPPEGLTYRMGEHLSIFQPNGYKKIVRESWVALDNEFKTREAANGRGPKPGDFIIIRGGYWKNKATQKRDLDSAHIMVLLEVLHADGKKVRWKVAQTGAMTNNFRQAGHITTLEGEVRDGEMQEADFTRKGPNIVFTVNIIDEEWNFPRRVVGYTDLDRVAFGAYPSAKFINLFQNRWREQATNEAMKVNPWLGWYSMESAGGFIQRHPTYLLLHRGHEAFKLERHLGPYRCTNRGLWTLAGSNVDVYWEDGSPTQSWTMVQTWSPRVRTGGTPRSANTGALTRVVQIPPAKLPSDVMPDWLVE
ncbi:MAG: hypothetical protein IT557_00315 [Alphaproteobacteria bacterium]|nr:hypothetical protein [Alphaproteobacteria bacterium]